MIEPSYGQFVDGGKGDFAYTYVTKYHEDVDEGDGDLPTIGPCCNTDYRQGPEKFQDPAESLNDSPLCFGMYLLSKMMIPKALNIVGLKIK